MDPKFKPSRVIEKEQKEKRKRRRVRIVFLVVVILASLNYLLPKAHMDITPHISAIIPPPFPKAQQVLHCLLLGIDPYDKPARTDTIIYAKVDRKNKVVYMISIPRDSRVDIPGHGMDKINHAHVFGGTDLTKQAVEGLLGVTIDYVVLTNIDAFVKAVDTLGGVEINVEKRMKYTDKRGGLYIDLQPGLQLLDGEKAMHYVRFRHDAEGDIGRIRRQQQFMKAVIEKALSFRKLPRIGTVYKELRDGIETNLKLTQLAWLANFMRTLGPEHLHMDMFPGTPEMIGGVSYWIPYMPGLEEILARIEKGEAFYNRALAHVRIVNRSGRAVARKVKNTLEDEGFDLFSSHINFQHPLDVTEVHYKEGKKEYAQIVAGILNAKIYDAADVVAAENAAETDTPDVEVWAGKDIFRKSNKP